MKTAASNTQAALEAAGVDAAKARAAAEDIGEIATELRVRRWMLGTMFVLMIAGFGAVLAVLVQILLRLPS